MWSCILVWNSYQKYIGKNNETNGGCAMKIEEGERNEIKVRVDNLDDLWYLYTIFRCG